MKVIRIASSFSARVIDQRVETRSERERAAALLKAVAFILRRTERREGARHAIGHSTLGPDPLPEND